jgi:hypothetical protein
MVYIERRPTEEEQSIIAAVYRDLQRLRAKGHHPVAVGMGSEVYRDPERGTWTRLHGLPVQEIRDPAMAVAVVLLLPVEIPETTG